LFADLDDLKVRASNNVAHVVKVDAAGAQTHLDQGLVQGSGERAEQP